jgi:hypothetical protein
MPALFEFLLRFVRPVDLSSMVASLETIASVVIGVFRPEPVR